MKVYSIYDSKAEAYTHPLFIRNKGEAIRSLQDNVNGSDSMYSKHPEDFTLFEIGTWDDLTGTLDVYPSKIAICQCHELKNAKIN